ncbi:unnamed protein product [Oikopleura dioica]|uniref:Homeobox domain-containing protein n=1 Tax=Oikopleura dioica TaxID=34765 RepID=E4YHF5_OIKDI|nr:unnamed protein product [Oikopleura dioica]
MLASASDSASASAAASHMSSYGAALSASPSAAAAAYGASAGLGAYSGAYSYGSLQQEAQTFGLAQELPHQVLTVPQQQLATAPRITPAQRLTAQPLERNIHTARTTTCPTVSGAKTLLAKARIRSRRGSMSTRRILIRQKAKKIMLAIITKMTLTQVSTWFANARRRLKKENKMTWVPKNRATDGEDDESNGLGEENEKDGEKDDAVAFPTDHDREKVEFSGESYEPVSSASGTIPGPDPSTTPVGLAHQHPPVSAATNPYASPVSGLQSWVNNQFAHSTPTSVAPEVGVKTESPGQSSDSNTLNTTGEHRDTPDAVSGLSTSSYSASATAQGGLSALHHPYALGAYSDPSLANYYQSYYPVSSAGMGVTADPASYYSHSASVSHSQPTAASAQQS